MTPSQQQTSPALLPSPCSAFVPRSVFARRYGIFGASMLPLGSANGGQMPSGVKVACMIDGELKEARYGETTHREICQREAIPGSVIVEGFSLPNAIAQASADARPTTKEQNL